MRIALFGGTFDPIHEGHLRAAKAAARKFRLDQVLFVPAGNPPHKLDHPLTPFAHRFAMVALACGMDRRFIPSLLEAPDSDGHPQYSVTTAQSLKRSLQAKDRLFFLVGADAFLDLPHWHHHRRLLDLVNFIVVSRPGFSYDDIWKVLPGRATDRRRGFEGTDAIRLRHTTLHVLHGVSVPLSSHDIRNALERGRKVAGLVPWLVEQYIKKEGLYLGPEARPTRQ